MPKNSKIGRMEKHIETSERKAGKSPKKAKAIAYATANKRKAAKK